MRKYYICEKAVSEADLRLLKMIVRPPVQITPEEHAYDENERAWVAAQGVSPYEDDFETVLNDRVSRRTVADEAGNHEHPTTRLFRVGIESIRAGQPSELFLTVLEQLAARAPTTDVLYEAFPRVFPAVQLRTLKASRSDDQIAEAFRAHVTTYLKRKTGGAVSFTDAKRTFKAQADFYGWDAKRVDRALAAHGLNWPAYRAKRT